MSQALTLARPYARAAHAVARDEGRVEAWSQALGFAAQVAADPRVAALLLNPELGSDQAVALLAEIARLFEQLRAEDQRVVRATVTSATELSAQELDKLREALKRRFGRDVEIRTAVDAGLIGGAVIDAGDVVIDGSLKGKLARLQTALAG